MGVLGQFSQQKIKQERLIKFIKAFLTKSSNHAQCFLQKCANILHIYYFPAESTDFGPKILLNFWEQKSNRINW